MSRDWLVFAFKMMVLVGVLRFKCFNVLLNKMTINVNNYGRFSPQYKVLAVKTLEEVSKNMDGFPPQCNLYLCKSRKDGLELFGEQARKFLKILGKSEGYHDEPVAYQTDYLFDFPDIIIVEDLACLNLKRQDEIEGEIIHEGGHAADYWKNQKLSFASFRTPLTDCIFYTKCEFEAENNAVNAGYSRQLLARDVRGFEDIKERDFNPVYPSFLNSLMLMGIYTAFMQNNKPNESQKQSLKKLWNDFAQNKRDKAVRSLLQSKELDSCPEKFGDESFLEDFIFQKHYGWNFSFI